jgi:hypothetical protein
MAFNFNKYKSNNPLLQEVEEEVSVSSSGVEMEEETKYPLIAVEKAALEAKEAGIDRETVVNIVNQTYGQGMSANLPI